MATQKPGLEIRNEPTTRKRNYTYPAGCWHASHLLSLPYFPSSLQFAPQSNHCVTKKNSGLLPLPSPLRCATVHAFILIAKIVQHLPSSTRVQLCVYEIQANVNILNKEKAHPVGLELAKSTFLLLHVVAPRPPAAPAITTRTGYERSIASAVGVKSSAAATEDLFPDCPQYRHHQ